MLDRLIEETFNLVSSQSFLRIAFNIFFCIKPLTVYTINPISSHYPRISKKLLPNNKLLPPSRKTMKYSIWNISYRIKHLKYNPIETARQAMHKEPGLQQIFIIWIQARCPPVPPLFTISPFPFSTPAGLTGKWTRLGLAFSELPYRYIFTLPFTSGVNWGGFHASFPSQLHRSSYSSNSASRFWDFRLLCFWVTLHFRVGLGKGASHMSASRELHDVSTPKPASRFRDLGAVDFAFSEAYRYIFTLPFTSG